MAAKVAAKKGAARKAAPGRARKAPKPPTRAQLLEHDPWHFRRTEDPTFAAICKLLRERPLVYDDWGPFIFGKPTRPMDAKILKAGNGRVTLDPDPICGSKRHLFNEPAPKTRWHASGSRGGGYIERFASSVVNMLDSVTINGRVVAPLHGMRGRPEAWSKWKTLPNGIEVWRMEYKATYQSGRQYSGRLNGWEFAHFGQANGEQPNGHIGGIYAYVQGHGAPCTTPTAWVAELAKATVEEGPRTASEALVAVLRRSYEGDLEYERKQLAECVYDDDGRFVRRRRTPKPPRRARSFERLLREAGFTPRTLGMFDREVERQKAAAAKTAEKQTNPTPKKETPCRTSKSRSRSASTARKPSAPGSRKPATSGSSRTAPGAARKTRSTPDIAQVLGTTSPRRASTRRATGSSPRSASRSTTAKRAPGSAKAPRSAAASATRSPRTRSRA